MSHDDPGPRCEFDRESLVLEISETIAADPREIAPLVHRIMLAIAKSGCANGNEAPIELALNEAVANAIVHGAKRDPTKQVQLCVACDEKHGLLIIVRDPGPGFDPNAIPSPVVGEHVFSSHGRGIFLINQLMDEVRFHRNGTEIHMLKRT